MGVKFNGVDAGDGGVRWYDPESGKVIRKELSEYGLDHNVGELKFSRLIIKSRKRVMSIHPKHVPSPKTKGAFYINGYCSDKDLRITFESGNKDRIVISKNLTDFLFCSTNQAFTSCFRLSNGDTNLKQFHATPGYYIAYITQLDGEYEYNGETYVHPKMQGRCWLFQSPDGQHFTVGRPYGKSGYELRDALRRFLPNGTEIGWEISEEFKNIERMQYDNIKNGFTIHDKYDKTFNSEPLYQDREIVITYKD